MLYIPTVSAAYIFGADFSKLYTFRFQVDWIMYKLRFPPLSNWRPPGLTQNLSFKLQAALIIAVINCLITPTMSLPLEEGKSTLLYL